MRLILLPELRHFFNSAEKEIIILGADKLRPSTAAFHMLQEQQARGRLAEESRTIFEYGQMFNMILLPVNGKVVRRFIHLISAEDFTSRTPDFQDRYLSWLDDQVNYLRINQNYGIVDTARAPAWGGPTSKIFVLNNVAEVFSSGGGTVITSGTRTRDSIVQLTRSALIESYVDQREIGPARKYYTQQNIDEFERYIFGLRQRLEKLRLATISDTTENR
jgi:hypothetical protein